MTVKAIKQSEPPFETKREHALLGSVKRRLNKSLSKGSHFKQELKEFL